VFAIRWPHEEGAPSARLEARDPFGDQRLCLLSGYASTLGQESIEVARRIIRF
jgi:hypothetical protein